MHDSSIRGTSHDSWHHVVSFESFNNQPSVVISWRSMCNTHTLHRALVMIPKSVEQACPAVATRKVLSRGSDAAAAFQAGDRTGPMVGHMVHTPAPARPLGASTPACLPHTSQDLLRCTCLVPAKLSSKHWPPWATIICAAAGRHTTDQAPKSSHLHRALSIMVQAGPSGEMAYTVHPGTQSETANSRARSELYRAPLHSSGWPRGCAR
jgi:hypothetical protein